VYPDARVSAFVSGNFIPVRLHVKKHPEAMGRFGADWTPTVMLLDSDGQERYRIEGFLPANDFLAHLELGLGHLYFKTGRFADAERQFRQVVDNLPNATSAAEAQYWAGVAKYKGGDQSALPATAAAFKQRYSDTEWAKKASIWG
jgi:thioredoxin-like negative regulator of GroEL